MDSRVAKRYARALFNTARRGNTVEAVEDDLNAIGNLLQNDDRFRMFMLSPKVSRDEKIQIAERLFSDRVTATTMQMLRLLLEKRREEEFDGIREYFSTLRREEGNVIYAEIISSAPLSDDERQRLIRKLEQETGKRVEADYRVDEHLIGGVRVAYENYVLDGSVRGALSRLRDSFRYEVLKQF